MIIFLIIAVLFVASLVTAIVIYKNPKRDYFDDKYSYFSVIALFSGVLTVILALIIGISHAPALGQRKLHQANLQKEAIEWQMKNDLYVGGELGDYNENVFRRQWLHENPWFSWFEGDWVMDLELIDTGEESQK